MLHISTAPKCTAAKWTERAITWEQFCELCSTVRRTPERYADYLAMDRDAQTRIKDVGGFVGGRLLDGKRSKRTVLDRCIITLDYDGCAPAPDGDMLRHPIWLAVQALDCAALVYTTHKHSAAAPRLRVCIPLDKPLPPHLYTAAARAAAEAIGFTEALDAGSYEAERLMFLPSASADGEFFTDRVGTALLDTALLLESAPAADLVPDEAKQLDDPREKPGIIGAFCRAYSITEAIDHFIPDVYTEMAPRRYTYNNGHTRGGMKVFDNDTHAYSWHGTDPSRGHCRNAYDLVRLHLYGDGDNSDESMRQLALADEKVRAELNGTALTSLGGYTPNSGGPDTEEPEPDNSWMDGLDRTRKGEIKNTRDNIIFIMQNHPLLKGRYYTDDFSGKMCVCGDLPWERPAGAEWRDVDDAHLRRMLERIGLTGKERIDDSIHAAFDECHRHPVREYLEECERRGFGGPRLDTLLVDYLGAADTPYTRAVTRKFFAAAVARIMEPGVKFDFCPVLAGPQGLGKSTLLRTLAGVWFDDSLQEVEGKDPVEQLKGKWIEEVGELSALNRAETNVIKAFISRQSDYYRPPYGRRAVEHPRQCVFCGTSNDNVFLRGDTNRRFWVIPVGITPARRSVWDDLPPLRDQIWAEAVAAYRAGEPLYLPPDIEKYARDIQNDYSIDSLDPLKEMLERYLSIPIPCGSWRLLSANQRRQYYRENDQMDPAEAASLLDDESHELRDRVAPVEFIYEFLQRGQTDKDYKELCRRTIKALRDLGWENFGPSAHCRSAYGTQKTYVKQSKLM